MFNSDAKIEVNDFENMLLNTEIRKIPEISRICHGSLNLLRDACILKMATDLCYQLKITNSNGVKSEVDIE